MDSEHTFAFQMSLTAGLVSGIIVSLIPLIGEIFKNDIFLGILSIFCLIVVFIFLLWFSDRFLTKSYSKPTLSKLLNNF